MAKEKYRSRTHMLLLYPDCDAHVQAKHKIEQSYDYALILHDRDIFTEEDEKKNPEHKAGDLKKPHWHVVLRCSNATWSTALCKELGIEHKYTEACKNFDNSLQYLLHYNDTDKTLYDIEEVKGSLKTKLKESINRQEKSEGERVVELIEFINDYDGELTVTRFATWCAKNGYWSEFRRSASIFVRILEEKNYSYQQNQCNKFE